MKNVPYEGAHSLLWKLEQYARQRASLARAFDEAVEVMGLERMAGAMRRELEKPPVAV